MDRFIALRMLKLSFILPCYNVGRYIADCLESIYAQDYSENEYEVICVNDCSTDNTRGIILSYVGKHPNLRLIDHTENLTAGGARNTGIKAAHGEYIWFVDPDDMIKASSVFSLTKIMEKDRLDILLFNFEDVDENGRFIAEDNTLSDSCVLSGQHWVSSFFDGRMTQLGIVWRCIFSSSFIRDHKLFYPMIRKSQDVVFIWKALLRADRVRSLSAIHYLFRVNPHSVTHNTRHADVLFSERVLFGEEIVKLMNDSECLLQPPLSKFLSETIHWCANTNKSLIETLPAAELGLYYEQMRKHKDSIHTLRPYLNWKNRIVLDSGWGEYEWRFRLKLMKVLCI